MKNLGLFVMFVCAIFLISCTKAEVEVQDLPKPDNSTLTELVEAPIEANPYKEGWTDKNRGFWAANYWAMLASNPQTRMRFLPQSVYEISTCIVDTWAQQVSFDEFNDNVGKSTNPVTANQMYQITYQCTDFEILRLKSKAEDIVLDPKKSI